MLAVSKSQLQFIDGYDYSPYHSGNAGEVSPHRKGSESFRREVVAHFTRMAVGDQVEMTSDLLAVTENMVLHTSGYHSFCQRAFGRFKHHSAKHWQLASKRSAQGRHRLSVSPVTENLPPVLLRVTRFLDRDAPWLGLDDNECESPILLDRETRRYLLMSHAYGSVVMLSKPADEAWHRLILETREYRHFCQTGFGRFRGHRPGKFSDHANLRGGVDRFTTLYEDLFGEAPPELVWNLSTDRKDTKPKQTTSQSICEPGDELDCDDRCWEDSLEDEEWF